MPVNSFENYPMSWQPKKSDLEKPYYLSIAALLERDILDGKLSENTKLPPQRELADFLDLNLSTITRAYKLCELKGLLYAVTGKGTFVSSGISGQDTFLDRNHNHHMIEMGMIKPLYECNQSILNVKAALKWLHHFGIDTTKENILLSAGAQNALSVILISLFKAGDKIAVDAFTYTNFKKLANFLHIQLIAIETDEYGMSPASLLQICKNTEIKGIYLMPTCSNPTSIFMPAVRRQEIADIVYKFHLLLIEDDIYSFLDPSDIKSFFSILPEQTIHICSISKSLCAGLRVAFFTFPAKYKEALVAGILNINLKTVSLNSEIVAELIENGTAFQIVRQKILLAQQRNKIYKTVFDVYEKDNIARFFYWLPIPERFTSEEIEILALQKGVHILGSHRFAMQSNQKSSYIRVSITSPDTENDLRKGLLILKNIFEDNTVNFLV